MAPMEKLNIDLELQRLIECISVARKKILLRSEVATTTNLRNIITKGCRALHYTGHGSRDCLAFECERGGAMYKLGVDELRKLFTAGGEAAGSGEVKLVFVSACHSEKAGQAFVEAGVPHVIAVRTHAEVKDKAAEKFAAMFYASLLQGGRTVREAFVAGCAQVAADVGAMSAEADKFMLLPEDSPHDAAIFGDLEVGDLIDETPPLPRRHNMPLLPAFFISRHLEMTAILTHMHEPRTRCISISGESGIGKTYLCMHVCDYLTRRRVFPGGMVYTTFEGVPTSLAKSSKALFDILLMNLEDERAAMDRPGLSSGYADTGLAVASDDTHYSRTLVLDWLSEWDSKRLIILDDVDSLLTTPSACQTFKEFVLAILRATNNVTLLVLACDGGLMDWLPARDSWGITLAPLNAVDSSKLFARWAPRNLQRFGDIGAKVDASTEEVIHTLSRHPVITALAGHPRAITTAARHLTKPAAADNLSVVNEDQRLGDLLPLVGRIISDSRLKKASPPKAREGKGPVRPARRDDSKSEGEYDGEEPLVADRLPESSLRPALQPVSDTGQARRLEILAESGGNVQAAELWLTCLGDESSSHNFSPWSAVLPAIEIFVTQRLVMGGVSRALAPEDWKAITAGASDKGWIDLDGSVSLHTFIDSLWPWLEKTCMVLSKIRWQWDVLSPVLVHGYIGREMATSMVAANRRGTFLLRLSFANPDSVAMSFRSAGGAVVHSLLQVTNRGMAFESGASYEYLGQAIMNCSQVTNLHPHHPKDTYFATLTALPRTHYRV